MFIKPEIVCLRLAIIHIIVYLEQEKGRRFLLDFPEHEESQSISGEAADRYHSGNQIPEQFVRLAPHVGIVRVSRLLSQFYDVINDVI